jgi:O-antigen ligase
VSPAWAESCAVPHNELLNALVLLGAVGLAVYLGLLRELWRLLSSARATSDARAATLAAAAQSCFVLLAITGMFHDLMYQSPVLVPFFFLAGLAAPAKAPEVD